MRTLISLLGAGVIIYSTALFVRLSKNAGSVCRPHPSDKSLLICSHLDIEVDKSFIYKNFKNARTTMRE